MPSLETARLALLKAWDLDPSDLGTATLVVSARAESASAFSFSYSDSGTNDRGRFVVDSGTVTEISLHPSSTSYASPEMDDYLLRGGSDENGRIEDEETDPMAAYLAATKARDAARFALAKAEERVLEAFAAYRASLAK
jgi:hypothetical protein